MRAAGVSALLLPIDPIAVKTTAEVLPPAQQSIPINRPAEILLNKLLVHARKAHRDRRVQATHPGPDEVLHLPGLPVAQAPFEGGGVLCAALEHGSAEPRRQSVPLCAVAQQDLRAVELRVALGAGAG